MVKKLRTKVNQIVPYPLNAELPKLSLRNLIHHRGEDPWVIYWEGNFYYTREYDDRQIMVHKASRLDGIGQPGELVWDDPVGTAEAEVWAPELHRLEGKWYIYFTRGKDEQHRMYVLEGTSDDPQGDYILKNKMTDPSDQWAIDGTIMYLSDKHYFVWSGWENETDKTQNLYIAPMSNPWTVSGERVCISRPEYDWEKFGAPDWPHINEGPQLLEKNGNIFIIYSASHSLTDDYCLGQLRFTGKDPLDPAAWTKKPEPVFRKSGSIFGPGHASFIEQPDGSDWIIYHSTMKSNAGWDARVLRAQRFTWHPDGSPNFGKPRAMKEIKIVEDIKARLANPFPVKKQP